MTRSLFLIHARWVYSVGLVSLASLSILATLACSQSNFSTVDIASVASENSMASLQNQNSLTAEVTAPACQTSSLGNNIPCRPLRNEVYSTFLDAHIGEIRIESGDNLNFLHPTANNQKIIIHKGSQIKLIATSYTGLALYFERPASEYKFSSGGNTFTVTDSCDRTTTFASQGVEVSFYFSDGSFAMNLIKQPSGPPLWRFRRGNNQSPGGTQIFLENGETISDIERTMKANLSSLNSKSYFMICPKY